MRTEASTEKMARQMLNDSDLAVSEIAQILHYPDARSFIRAFRRWSDSTPARWRATQKQLRRTPVAQRSRRDSTTYSP